MKIGDIKGKEVIDGKGNSIGQVEDIDLDLRNRKVESLIIREGGLTARIGTGDIKTIPCSMVDKIGEKVLLKVKTPIKEDLDVITGGE